MSVAICIPTYKRKDLLLRAVKSIPEYFSVYVSDNGGYLPEGCLAQFPNVKVLQETRFVPAIENWNRVIRAALDNNHNYISICCDDDYYIMDKMQVVYDQLMNETAGVVVYGHVNVSESSSVLSEYRPKCTAYNKPDGFKVYMYGVDARMMSIFFSKKIFRKIGLFDDRFTICTDSFFIQKALIESSVRFYSDVIASYTIWDGSDTSNKISTSKWLDEIDGWTSEISKCITDSTLDIATYKDEVYARNLCAGLSNLFNNGEYDEVLTFKANARWPSHALAKTKLRILLLLLKAKLKSYAS